MRITIDRERCMGSGNCAFWAPNTFDLDDDMKAIVIEPVLDRDPIENVSNAIEACPTHALGLVDEQVDT